DGETSPPGVPSRVGRLSALMSVHFNAGPIWVETGTSAPPLKNPGVYQGTSGSDRLALVPNPNPPSGTPHFTHNRASEVTKTKLACKAAKLKKSPLRTVLVVKSWLVGTPRTPLVAICPQS